MRQLLNRRNVYAGGSDNREPQGANEDAFVNRFVTGVEEMRERSNLNSVGFGGIEPPVQFP